MKIPLNLRRDEPAAEAVVAEIALGHHHLAGYLLASGNRDVAHELARPLTPWAKARVLEQT